MLDLLLVNTDEFTILHQHAAAADGGRYVVAVHAESNVTVDVVRAQTGHRTVIGHDQVSACARTDDTAGISEVAVGQLGVVDKGHVHDLAETDRRMLVHVLDQHVRGLDRLQNIRGEAVGAKTNGHACTEELEDIGHANRVAHVGLGIVYDCRAGLGQHAAVFVGQVDAVAADGLLAQNAVTCQTVYNGLVIGRAAMVAVVCALADMDMEACVCVLTRKGHSLLRDGKRCMHAAHCSQQAGLVGLAVVLEALVFQYALACLFRTVAVGNLIAQAGAHAQGGRCLGDLVQAALDLAKRSVMIENSGHARTDALDEGHVRRHAGHGTHQMTVNIPPGTLEHAREIGRAVARDGQTACESRIDMMVRVDEAGQDDAALGVDALGIGMRLLQCSRRADFQNHAILKQDCTLFHHRLRGIPGQNCAICQ